MYGIMHNNKELGMKLTSFTAKALAFTVIFSATTGLAFAEDADASSKTPPTQETHAKDQPSLKPASFKDRPRFKDHACPIPPMLQDGFYAGIQGGYDSYRDRQNINSPGASGIIGTTALSATGVEGGLFVGYGATLTNWFYLGGEIFANTSNAGINYSTSDALGTYTARFKAHDTWGIALLPGANINNTSLAYLRFGWNWANLKSNESVTGSPSTSKSNTSNGFNAGLGLESLLKGNFSLRTEFSHTWYNSFNTGYGSSINPSDNQFNLGLIYHFYSFA